MQSVRRLSPLVTLVPGLNPSMYTLSGTNTYLIGNGASRLLIDTGAAGVSGYLPNLANTLGIQGCSLTGILCTHWHKDHTGGIVDILRAFPGIPVHKFKMGKFEENLFSPIERKQTFTVPGATLEAIYTPGHAMDHVAFYLREEEALFSGDLILGGSTVVFNDLEKYLLSLQGLVQQRPRMRKIYPGHGPVVEKGLEKINQDLEHRKAREKQIWETIRATTKNPASLSRIVEGIYQGYPEELKKAAEGGIKLHLLHLEKQGKIRRIGQSGGQSKADPGKIYGPGGLSISQIHGSIGRRTSMDAEMEAAQQVATGIKRRLDPKSFPPSPSSPSPPSPSRSETEEQSELHIAHQGVEDLSHVYWQLVDK